MKHEAFSEFQNCWLLKESTLSGINTVSYSLKSSTRSNRGQELRRRVDSGGKLPGDWSAFLRVNDNKTEPVKYLDEQVSPSSSREERKSCPKELLTSSRDNTSLISPCTHEEADTKLLLHAFDGGKEVCTKVMLRTVAGYQRRGAWCCIF